MSLRMAGITSGPAVPRPAPLPSPVRSQRFGELVASARAAGSPAPATVSRPNSLPSVAPAAPTATSRPPAIGDIGRQLLARVARGERAVESMVRQGLSGRAFTPADLLAMQAQVYRYGQEIELISKLAERGTSAVKTVLQQNG